MNVAPLSLSLGDASVTEGVSGTSATTFTVSLSRASAAAVSYNIATADGKATAGSDYVARSLTGDAIAVGQTSRTFTVTVTVNGDQQGEPNEAFTVNLNGATGATLADAQATGTIVSDDARVMSSPLPARPGTGSTTQGSPPIPASPAQATVPIGTSACPPRGGAPSCTRQMPLRWLQAWNRLLVLLTR